MVLPQILGSLPEVIRSWCAHHHHHHHHHKVFARPFGVERSLSRLNRPSSRVAGPGKRHSARGTPRAQPRDVRSAGRDTWNLTGEALGGPRKRSWRRCSRARSGRRSAIRGAHSPLRCPRPPLALGSRRARPDLHERPLLCGRRRRQLLCSRGAPALSLPTARCWRARGALPVQARAGTGTQGADVTSLFGISCQLGVDRCAHLQ